VVRGVHGFDFLADGGEMGERIRTFDWACTSLGPLTSWPQSLHMAVSLCVKTRHPTIVYLGRDCIPIYNDAMIPKHGPRHPGMLGQPFRQTWPELWPILGPMLQSVLDTGLSTWAEDMLLVSNRHGYFEESYFTFSCTPIFVMESGTVAGSMGVTTETTHRVIGERRLRTLRDLAARTGETQTAAEAFANAAEVLAANPYDVPFALIYFVEDDRKRARLVGCAGLPPGTPASPRVVDLTNRDPALSTWLLARVAATGKAEHVEALETLFGPLPGGAWPAVPQSALVLPINFPGHKSPATILVAAVNPRKALDADQRAFFDSVAAQLATTLADVLAHEEQRKRSEALAELNRAKTAFFSNVSHEFRTPLTLMLGPLQDLLARPGAALDPKDLGALEMAHRNGLRLQKMVNALLDFSRIEAGRMNATCEPTDLAALTSDLASIFRSSIERAGLRLVVSCPPLPEPVYVDREMWEKVVLNLLSNAFKFTFEGEIRADLRQVDTAVEFSVSDTGVGIPQSDLPHVFERFFSGRGTRGRTHEGSGIGLALVQELVRLHGGAVRVASVPGQGSTFTVSLPLGKDHLPAERLSDIRTPTTPSTGASAFVEEALHWLPEKAAEGAALAQPNGNSTERPRILVVDDNADMRVYVRHLLSAEYEVATAENGAAALAALRCGSYDLVLSDVMMPRLDGFQLLKELRSDAATTSLPVILLSARAGEESTVEGLDRGADDYIVKPFNARELTARVAATLALARLCKEAGERQALTTALAEARQQQDRLRSDNMLLQQEMRLKYNYEEIIGHSAAIQKVLLRVEQVARTGSTVLLLGETGTGKELLARAIHGRSARHSRPMVTLNCAALPSTLIESELFGREKGAYTGALTGQAGRFEQADGSTLFLDEIGELPPEMQAKLLRVLQEGQFERLGGAKTLKVDVRLIAATNRDLSRAMSEGKFRNDLYYRLNVFPIRLPPLRERLEDIPLLVWSFVKELALAMGKTIESIPRASLEALRRYDWPGNVRELRNVIERALIVCPGPVLNVEPPEAVNPIDEEPVPTQTLEEVERGHIRSVLMRTGWRVSGRHGAAEVLGLKPTTLESRMAKLGIKRDP
jgi:DNA-binding NtrC family response regulator/signal transduction histidine kinase